MNLPSTRKSGSSLLLTVLLLTGIGLLVLTGNRLILEGSRSATRVNNTNRAKAMALSGMQEGLMLYHKNLLLDGEYGNPNPTDGQYHLKPVRRGYKRATAAPCTEFAVDEPVESATSYDPECPYYDFSVRNTVGLSSTTTPFNLTTRELPNNLATILPIKRSTGGITMDFAIITGFTYDYRLCSTYTCAVGSATSVTTNGPATLSIPTTINFPTAGSTVRAIEITPHYTTASNHVILVDGVVPTGGVSGTNFLTQIALGKGFTTIDVVGYAGDARKRMVAVLRKNDRIPGSNSATTTVNAVHYLDVIERFDEYGILK